MKVNGPGRQNLVQGRNHWQLVKHAQLYFDLLQAMKGKPSVLAIPHWGLHSNTYKSKNINFYNNNDDDW